MRYIVEYRWCHEFDAKTGARITHETPESALESVATMLGGEEAEAPPSMVVVEFVCPECGQALGITVVGEGAAQEVS
jgi:hypothetical protein